jgi:hypothetical protein
MRLKWTTIRLTRPTRLTQTQIHLYGGTHHYVPRMNSHSGCFAFSYRCFVIQMIGKIRVDDGKNRLMVENWHRSLTKGKLSLKAEPIFWRGEDGRVNDIGIPIIRRQV